METIRIADIITNDVLNGQGICTSIWLQGCPHRCPGCHNPQAWDFNGGTVYYQEMLIKEILELLSRNGIKRNLSFLGGEPLCPENRDFCIALAKAAKEKYPEITIFCWTGYTIEQLDKEWLKDIDVLIDGPFIQEQRDITLYLRGSKNQRVLHQGIDY